MKLLLLSFVVLFFCLLIRTENEQASLKKEAETEVVMPLTQIASEFPVIVAETDWLKTYFLMLKVLNPVKQLDLPGDYKMWSSTFYKLLHASSEYLLTVRQKACYTSKYMRLLSARHRDGFYVYSLGKLII